MISPVRDDTSSLPPSFRHAMALYASDHERQALLRQVITLGLTLGQRVLIAVDPGKADASAATIEDARRDAGPDQVDTIPLSRLFGAGQPLDHERALEVILKERERALSAGWTGLTVALDMSGMALVGAEARLLVDYDALLHRALDEHDGVAVVCLFDRGAQDALLLLAALRAHPHVLLDGLICPNPFALPPAVLTTTEPAPLELDRRLEIIREDLRKTRELTSRQAHYQHLFDSLISGFALHEMLYEGGEAVDYRFLEANPKFEEMTGLSVADILGRTVLEILPGLERSWIERYAAVVETGAPLRFTQYSEPLDRHYEVYAYRPLPGQFVTLFHDVTERVLAEEARRQAEEKMWESQRLESLGLLAGGIAHDFNNLLVGILGNASLATLDLPITSPARDSLKDIEIAAQRAADLARQLLAYSGRGRFVVEPFDLGGLVEEMSHLLEAVVPKNVTLKLQIRPGIEPVVGDAAQIRQVVMNLITNAAESIGAMSGIVNVALGAMSCDRTYLDDSFGARTLPEGRYVYLEVSDTGCGMDSDTIARIFDPFFSTKPDGRGLGLAAALGIVRGHKGALRVYSEVGRGTTFKILLPAEPDATIQARAEVASEGFVGHGTILVVDDEEMVRATVRKILVHLGFDVLTAEDGRSGVAMYSAHADEIRMVLLDMMMPHMCGEDAFVEMRRIQPEVKVLLTSGYNEQEAVQRFVGRGLAGFIQKPFHPRDLAAKIREVLNEDAK
jgi:PAS domain S-box-containing protein